MGREVDTSTAVMHAHAVPTLYYYILMYWFSESTPTIQCYYRYYYSNYYTISTAFLNIFLCPPRTGRQLRDARWYNNTAEFFSLFRRITKSCA